MAIEMIKQILMGPSGITPKFLMGSSSLIDGSKKVQASFLIELLKSNSVKTIR
jgi:hypothetical protein